jgi:hypothetical protein
MAQKRKGIEAGTACKPKRICYVRSFTEKVKIMDKLKKNHPTIRELMESKE